MADNLLDKASILLTPTAYNDGSMLSIKPENGDGDFTFSRDGNASRVNSAGNIVTESANLPRIDYTDGCGSWLLEPQSTNLVTYSSDFSQWTLGSNATLSYESDIVAPDGSLGVYRLTLPAQSSTFLLSNIFTGQNPLALSIYAKSAATNNDFNLFDGTTSSSLKTATSEWQRFDYVGSGSQLAIVNQGDTFITDIYIWGAQAEALSYATSYIPTNGAIATRLADVCQGGGDASVFNDSEGVLYAEVSRLNGDLSTTTIAINKGGSEFSGFSFRTDGKIWAATYNGTSYENISQYTPTDFYDTYKMCYKYKSNDFALWVNGVEVDSSVVNTLTLTGLNNLSFSSGNATNKFLGNVRALHYFPEALTDAELQSLTTI
jgi:hypothetical protein